MPGKKQARNKKQANEKAGAKPAARKARGARKAGKSSARPKTPDRRGKADFEKLRLRSAAPSFTVDDLEKSQAFYEGVLGFHVKERWIHEGKLAGVELVAGVVSVFLGQDDWKKGKNREKGEGFRVYCTTVQDIDELAAQIKARGGQLLEEPKTQSWGTRDFAVADPDGFKLTFSSDMK
jgi:catechol 2,3-dioxygenase-like lactoylglutathione lyase family enzyme